MEARSSDELADLRTKQSKHRTMQREPADQVACGAVEELTRSLEQLDFTGASRMVENSRFFADTGHIRSDVERDIQAVGRGSQLDGLPMIDLQQALRAYILGLQSGKCVVRS